VELPVIMLRYIALSSPNDEEEESGGGGGGLFKPPGDTEGGGDGVAKMVGTSGMNSLLLATPSLLVEANMQSFDMGVVHDLMQAEPPVTAHCVTAWQPRGRGGRRGEQGVVKGCICCAVGAAFEARIALWRLQSLWVGGVSSSVFEFQAEARAGPSAGGSDEGALSVFPRAPPPEQSPLNSKELQAAARPSSSSSTGSSSSSGR
jgi:hypothetical protein